MNRRRDHLVPRFYLEGFTSLPSGRRKPCVFVFDKEQKRCYPRSAEQVWKLANYYDIKGSDGEPDDVLDRVNREIETKASPLFKAGGFLVRRDAPNERERELISWFAGMMDVRVPELHSLMAEGLQDAVRRGLVMAQWHCKGEPGRFENAVRSLERQLGVRITGATLDDLSRVMIDPEIDDIKTSAFQAIDIPRALFCQMPWTILVAKGEDVFITSDRPLLRENLSPLGRPGFVMHDLNQYGFSFILPLTQKYAVATHCEMDGEDRGFVDATTDMVTMVNAEVWWSAPRYRFAPREDFTGREVITNQENLSGRLASETATLSKEAKRVVKLISYELSHGSVEAADKAAAEILHDPWWRLDQGDVQQMIQFVERLIANLAGLPKAWADRLPWWRRKLIEFAEVVMKRAGQEGETGDVGTP